MINGDISAGSTFQSPSDIALPLQWQRPQAENYCEKSQDRVPKLPRVTLSQGPCIKGDWRTSRASKSRLSSGATRGWSGSGANATVSYSRVGYDEESDVCECLCKLSIVFSGRLCVHGGAQGRISPCWEQSGRCLEPLTHSLSCIRGGSWHMQDALTCNDSIFLISSTTIALQVRCGWGRKWGK